MYKGPKTKENQGDDYPKIQDFDYPGDAGREEQLKNPKRGVFFHKVKALFLAIPQSMWHSSPTRGQTPTPCLRSTES